MQLFPLLCYINPCTDMFPASYLAQKYQFSQVITTIIYLFFINIEVGQIIYINFRMKNT